MDAYEWEAYEQALARQEAEDARQVRPPLPSLRTLMIDYVRTSSVPIQYSNDDPLLGGLVEQLGDCNPYYNLRPSPAQMTSRQGRHGGAQSSQIIVSAATLIVVPTDLVLQWKDEIAKHVEKGTLRVLVLRTKKNGFVTAQQLAGYDLVLMSIARFGDAAGDPHSPLRRVHWRRLMVDEGHTLSSANRTRLLAEEVGSRLMGSRLTLMRRLSTAASRLAMGNLGNTLHQFALGNGGERRRSLRSRFDGRRQRGGLRPSRPALLPLPPTPFVPQDRELAPSHHRTHPQAWTRSRTSRAHLQQRHRSQLARARQGGLPTTAAHSFRRQRRPWRDGEENLQRPHCRL